VHAAAEDKNDNTKDKKVEFISDRMLYITLRDCYCGIFILNVHAPTEDKVMI
jgi:hypothetical protein